MREIKFRFWHKEDKQFFSPWSRGWRFEGENGQMYVNGMNVTERCEIMQYTGLKDRNGVELYDGDFFQEEDRLYLVQWDSKRAQYVAKVVETKYVLTRGLSFPLWQYADNVMIQIAGNIYEHPHLLTKEE